MKPIDDPGVSNHVSIAQAVKTVFEQEYPDTYCTNVFQNKAAIEVCRALNIPNVFIETEDYYEP